MSQEGIAQRLRHDCLVAFSLLLTSSRGMDRDGRTWVEAVEQGWWYSTLLPAGKRLVVYLTDRDLAPMARVMSAAGFISMLQTTRHLWSLCEAHAYQPDGSPQSASAATNQLSLPAGSRWLAVGDAAQSFDPLSSQGISQALFGGLKAGHAIDAALNGDLQAVPRHVDQLHRVFQAYMTNCRTVYEAERRWASSPFWRRRRGTSLLQRSKGRSELQQTVW